MGLGFGLALAACGGEGGDDDGSGGSNGNPGTGGAAPTGGTSGDGGSSLSTGGTTATGGATASGGAEASGGATASGGAEASGGATGTGGTDDGTGGDPSTGGDTGTGGMDDSGDCETGTTQGDEVLFIGESFVAASSIPEETTNLARAAGSLGPSDSYLDESISGTWIGNGAANSIPSQYRDHSDGIRFVLMNGGGNDCWQGGTEQDRNNALDAASELFDDMAENGVEKIVYFFYPDPIGGQYASLTACLDLLRPDMKALCDGLVSPECHWVDLRDTWDGHPEYTSDGIHVAGPGNVPTATAIFEAMQENCVAP